MADSDLVRRVQGSSSRARQDDYQRRVEELQRAQEARRQLQEQQANSPDEGPQGLWANIGNMIATTADFVNPDDWSTVPVIGPVAKGAADAYTQSTRGINMGISGVGLALNPSYWENRDDTDANGLWQDAQSVSAGRSAIAALDAAGLGGPVDVYDTNPNRNIVDQTQQDEVFNAGWGRVSSGLVDGAVTWFLDPLVIAGKALKVGRMGTQAFGLDIVGLTNRRMTGTKAVQQVVDEADTALANPDVLNTIRYEARKVAEGDFEDLRKREIFQGSNRDLLAAAGAAIENEDEAVMFLAAVAGSQKYQAMLRAQQPNLYAGLQRQTGLANPYEIAALNRPWFTDVKAFEKELKDKGVTGQAILDDLAKRNVDFAEMMGIARRERGIEAAASLADEADGFSLLDTFGGRSVTGKRMMDAWREGREVRTSIAKRPLDPKRTGTRPAVEETIFQVSSFTPRVRAWEWVKGEHASGYINISGWNEGKASDELMAAISDSPTLRNDKEFINWALKKYGEATGVKDKVKAISKIEYRGMKIMAQKHGVDPAKYSDKEIVEIYRKIDNARWKTVDAFRSRAYVTNEFGDVIKGGPVLRSQLEHNMPMLNFSVLEKSAKILAKPKYLRDKSESHTNLVFLGRALADEVLSLWKASVLLRLGYTMRNTAEGWLRTAAYLGALPAAKAAGRGVANSAYNNWRRFSKHSRVIQRAPGRLRPTSMRYDRALATWVDEATTSIVEKRSLLDDMLAKRAQMFAANPQRRTKKYDKAINELNDEIQALSAHRDRLSARLADLNDRRFWDPGAFGGEFTTKAITGKRQSIDLGFEYGDLARRLSSADKTIENVLMSEFQRGNEVLMSQNRWGKIKPKDPQYWQELAGASRQFRADPLARQVLEGRTDGELVVWLESSAAREYRRDLHVPKHEASGKVAQIREMVERYLPTPEARAAALDADVTPDALKFLLGHLEELPKKPKKGSTAATVSGPYLSPIHGREVQEIAAGQTSYSRYWRRPIESMFKLLGSYPETTLVRHPFYGEVWARKMNDSIKQARAMGRTIDTDVLQKMNSNAHRHAMRETNETLYTIERYSNLAEAFRFAAPFFAAWENSAKVWTKMIVNDPSILARASILWQIPNKIGMVVDEEGNPVKEDSFFSWFGGNQKSFVVMPEEFTSALKGAAESEWGQVPGLGSVLRGAAAFPIAIRQGSLNVVTPGDVPWMPGSGPLVTVPVGTLLNVMGPEVQKVTEQVLGEEVYRALIAPTGAPEANPLMAFAPAWVRQMFYGLAGEGSDDFLKAASAVMQNEMVTWYKNGADPASKPKAEDVMNKARDFFVFSSISRLTMPAATTRMSPYQLEVDAWRALRDDNSLTWEEKVETFLTNHGEEFLPLTVSSTSSSVPGLEPDLGDYRILKAHDGLARELAAQGGAAVVGILAGSSLVGEFDEGVWSWLQNNNVPGTNDALREARDPMAMQNAIILADAWSVFRRVKAERDQALAVRGLSPQSKDAEGIMSQWRQFEDEMAAYYGGTWTSAYGDYQNNSAKYLTGISTALRNETFMSSETGKSQLWQQIGVYMDTRESALDAIRAGADSALVRDQWAEWSAQYRFSSLEFSDFYDKFLDGDAGLQDYDLEALNVG